MSTPAVWPDRLLSVLADAAPDLRVGAPGHAPDIVADALTAVVPGCDWAAVVFPALRSDGRVDRPFRDAATDPALLGVLAAETTSRSGPVRDVRRGPAATSSYLADAIADPRYPEFGRRLAEIAPGVRSLTLTPVEVASRGVVVLAAVRPHALGAVAARLDALVAPVELFLRLAWAEHRARQLRVGLESHRVVGTATGLVMAVDGVDADEALAHLRDSAQHDGRRLVDVATEVVTTHAQVAPTTKCH